MSKKPKSHIDDLNDFCNLWDKACQSGIFDEEEVERPPLQLGDGLAAKLGLNLDDEDEYEEETGDDPYYGYNEDESLLQETAKKRTPNPIYPASSGKDQNQPKPTWVDNKMFERVEDLKRRLYNIECKLGEQDAGGKRWTERAIQSPAGQKLISQIESLRTQIDELSDMLGIEDEPEQSMWAVAKRK